MTDSAIQEDALVQPGTGEPSESPTAEQQEEVRERQVDPREAAMDAIHEKHVKTIEEEAGIKINEDPATSTDGTEPEKPAAAGAEPQEVELTDTGNYEHIKVRVKVDGEERMVPLSEVVRTHQKESAASQRLEQATKKLRDADEIQRQAIEKAKALAEETSEATPQDGNVAKEFIVALFEGDEEKAMAAFNRATGSGRSNPIQDPEELARQLTPAVKQQLLIDDALQRFNTEYQDIVQDPYLASVADNFLQAELDSGTPFLDAVDVAGKQTRAWVREKAGVPVETATATARGDRLERKQAIDTIPAASARSGSMEEPEATPSQVIQQMREQRGL